MGEYLQAHAQCSEISRHHLILVRITTHGSLHRIDPHYEPGRESLSSYHDALGRRETELSNAGRDDIVKSAAVQQRRSTTTSALSFVSFFLTYPPFAKYLNLSAYGIWLTLYSQQAMGQS